LSPNVLRTQLIENIRAELSDTMCKAYREAANEKQLKRRIKKKFDVEWKWEGRKRERINEFRYLGYTFNARATD
jgi:hypothetical protein